MRLSFPIRAVGLALILTSGMLNAQASPDKAADPKDAALSRIRELGKATGVATIDPASRQLVEAMRKALLVELPQPDGDNGASYARLATGVSSEGSYDVAESLLRVAVDRDERLLGKDHPGTATALDKLAQYLNEQNRFEEAEPLLRRAMAIDEQAIPNSPRLASVLTNLALALMESGREAEAEPHLRRALVIQDKALGADNPFSPATLRHLGALLARRGADAEAEKHYRRALQSDLASLGDGTLAVGEDLSGLGRVLSSAHREREAEAPLVKALIVYSDTLGFESTEAAAVAFDLGLVEFAVGREGLASNLLRAACPTLAAATSVRGLHGATRRRLVAHSVACSTALASFLWTSYRPAPGRPVSGQSGTSAGLLSEAFAAVQAAQSSSAAEALSRYGARAAAASRGVGTQADDYEAALEARDALDRALADELANATDAARQTRSEIAARRDAVAVRIDRAAQALKNSDARYWSFRLPDVVTVTALQARQGEDAVLLRDEEALVVLNIPPGEVHGQVFAISKDAAAWAEIGLTGAVLTAKIQKLRALIDPAGYTRSALARGPVGKRTANAPDASQSTQLFDRRLAFEVFQALFGDKAIQSVIGPKLTMLLVPSGPMTMLPPALLVTTEPKGGVAGDSDDQVLRDTDWLIRQKAIAILPSVTSLRTLRQVLPANRSAPPDPLLAFADPRFQAPSSTGTSQSEAGTFLTSHPPVGLPGTRIEAQALARALGAADSSVLMGEWASKAELMARNVDGRLARTRVLEFATHAAFAGEIPGLDEPALLLASGRGPEDQLLAASEAASLRLTAEWVLLSACDTASPDRPDTPGLSGLTKAFFLAGARSLLVSHWHVRDDITARLIPRTIQAQTQGNRVTRAEALRQAELSILDDKSLTAADPAAWAPFVLIGEAAQ